MSVETEELAAFSKWLEYLIRVLQMEFLQKGRFEDILQLDRKIFIQAMSAFDQDPPFDMEP